MIFAKYLLNLTAKPAPNKRLTAGLLTNHTPLNQQLKPMMRQLAKGYVPYKSYPTKPATETSITNYELRITYKSYLTKPATETTSLIDHAVNRILTNHTPLNQQLKHQLRITNYELLTNHTSLNQQLKRHRSLTMQ